MGKIIIAYINANLKYGFKWQRIYREPPKLVIPDILKK